MQNEKALLRITEALAFTGNKRSAFYWKITDGLMVEGVGIGGEARAWPLGELQAINEARIAGKSDEEIRELVIKLESARAGKPAAPRRKARRAPAAAAA